MALKLTWVMETKIVQSRAIKKKKKKKSQWERAAGQIGPHTREKSQS